MTSLIGILSRPKLATHYIVKFFFSKTEPHSVEKEYKVEASITEGNLVASLKVVPLSSEVTSVAEADLYDALTTAGVTFGIWNDAVHRMAEEKALNTWVTVAKGEKAGDGQDGYVRFHFSREGNKVRLKEDANGRVNFKDMNLIQNVKKGDILCELIPPEEGKTGTSVKGEVLHGKLGAIAKLPSGKNVESSEGGTKLIAAIDGMVVWQEPQVIVEPIYVVDKVDSSTGNIRFNGTVIVNGEVGDGFEIHAAEDVTIAMSVGRVTIESGGNIRIMGGVLGQEKAYLSAQGSVRVKFAQDAHINAKKEIIVDDYIRSSTITAVGPVIIKSPTGWVSGGMVSSEAWVYCHTIGSSLNPMDTKLTIGHNPQLYSEREQSREDIIEKIGDFLKLQTSTVKLRTLKAQGQLSQAQEKLYEKILSAVETIRQQLHSKDERLRELTDKINTVYAGNIYVEGTANEGTKIIIGSANRDIHSPRVKVQFSLKEGEIAESEFVMLPEIKDHLESE
jgi:uncharacterized protein